jgi:hypothetical protein
MDQFAGTDFFADRGFHNTLACQQAPISSPVRRNADGRIERYGYDTLTSLGCRSFSA